MIPERAAIRHFFRQLDAFLLLQFDVLDGRAAPSAVAAAHAELVGSVERRRAGPDAAHWERWLTSLTSADVLLFGFPSLAEPLSPDELREQQLRLADDPRAHAVRQRLDLDYDALLAAPAFALVRSCAPDWLEQHDVRLRGTPDPSALAARLFALDGKAHHLDRLHLEFRPSRTEDGRFFMARLNDEPRCVIGHAPPATLFRLSSLAHEIGHASSYELDHTPEDRFLTVDGDEPYDLSEVDAYRYERLLADHLDTLADGLLDHPDAAREHLLTRKALQAFRHLLACRLASLWFAGHAPEELAAVHDDLVRRFLPHHPADGAWLAATDLARPLARVPYAHAFERAWLTTPLEP